MIDPPSAKSSARRWLAASLILAAVGMAGIAMVALGARLDPHDVATFVGARRTFASEHLAAAALFYFVAYCGFAALALPGAWVVSVAGGALFGPWLGAPLALLSNTAGATLAMLASRYLLRETIRARFARFVEKVDAGVARDGALWLLAARLAPMAPFFLVNLAVGLTHMPALTFAAVSAAGALPLIVVFVMAGSTLATIERLSDVLSPGLLVALIVSAVAILAAGPLARRVLETKSARVG